MYPKENILQKYLKMTEQQPIKTEATEIDCSELIEQLNRARAVNKKLEEENKLLKQQLDRYKVLFKTTRKRQVTIGPNTKVRRRVLKSIKWHSYTDATRKILVDVFTRRKIKMYPKQNILQKYLKMTEQQPIKTDATDIDCSELIEQLNKARAVNKKLEEENKFLKQQLDRYKVFCKTTRKRQVSNERNTVAEDNDSPATKVKKEIFSYNDTDSDEDDDKLVPIGPNTKVRRRVLKCIKWHSYTDATRKILVDVFTRRVLATHSLTGKSSPAFPNKEAKKKLNPKLVEDIVTYVADHCHASITAIRTSITSKCADESKMLRTRKHLI